MRRLTVYVCALAFLFLLSSATALANEELAGKYESGDYRYDILDDGTVKIARYLGNAEELRLPDEIDGRKVTAIADGGLGCSPAVEITLPDDLVSIDRNPFSDCENLVQINISAKNPCFETIDGVLFTKTNRSLICYPCGRDDTVYPVPEDVCSIGEGAFSNCSSIKTVVLPEVIKKIGTDAFLSCENLETVVLPEGLTTIGDQAFAFCTSLAEIDLPDSLTDLGGNVFNSCPLVEIRIPNGISTVEYNVFYRCDNLKKVELPQSIRVIEGYAFYKCQSLESIVIPEGTEKIYGAAFTNCTNLSYVSLPESVSYIAKGVFYGCKNLTVRVSVGSYAEQYCNENGIRIIYN